MSVDTNTRPRSWRLPAFSIVLAIVAWVAAVVWLSFAMGDVNDEDPIQKAKLMARHQLIARSALVLFITALVGSSWLGGNIFQSGRAASLAVLAIHLAAMFGVIFLVSR